MVKKLSILCVCSILFFGFSAYAHNVKIEEGTRTVIYTDNISPNTRGIIFVVKAGKTIVDNENIYMLTDSISDNQGEIRFEFNMPETKGEKTVDGEYDIYLKEKGNDVKKVTMNYASLASRTTFENEVKKIASSSELKEVLENPAKDIVLKILGCDTYLYTNKTAEAMYALVNDFETVTWNDFSKAYNTVSALYGVGEADKEKVVARLEFINPAFENVSYINLEDKALINWIISQFDKKYYQTVIALEDDYKVANMLYKINNSVADKFHSVLGVYANELGINNEETYKDYIEITDKIDINLEIAEVLNKTPAKNAQELLSVIRNAIEEDGDNKKEHVMPGGGRGDSSSKRVGYVSSVPVQTSPEELIGSKTVLKDINDAEWARTAIETLVSAEIINGDGDGNFRPNDLVTREEFVKMLVVASGKYNENAKCYFNDILKKEWHYSYIASAVEAGIVRGISEAVFGKGMYLTRQDMAVLCSRAKGDIEEVREEAKFKDDGDIADYAKESVLKLYKAGAINGMGDNTFAPFGQATRAQCAQLIYNLFLK